MEKNSLVRVFILQEIEQGEKSGYDIINSMGEQTGGKKPSAGTIYPLLKDLTETKQISHKTEGRKKLYKITAKGKKTLKELQEHHQSLMKEHQRMLNVFSQLSNNKFLGKAKAMAMIPMHQNKWMRYNMDVIGEFKKEIIDLMSQPFDQKKADLWRKQMQKNIKFVRGLKK